MRRLLPWVLALALPVASAAGFSLPTGRIAEAVGAPGGELVFEVPVEAQQDGLLYAKVLPTPGNAVDDGTRSNGSVEDATGWRVSFALVRAGPDVEELGTFADGSMSRLAPIRAGERLALRATVHAPADALSGGALQHVYVALAYRDAPAGADPGATSGAQMDAARALTLVVRLSGTAVSLPPGPPDGEGSGNDAEVPPVTPVDLGGAGGDEGSRVFVVQQAPMPTWFMGGLLAVLGALALVGGAIAYALLAALLDARRAQAGVRVPVRAHRGPSQDPLQAESGKGRP